MNTDFVKRDLLESLKADPEYRHAWNFENVYTGVCFQIRAIREQRGWSQAALGKAARMAPERISILEDPNADTKPTLSTLLRIANACDVGLDVRFVPYGTILDRSTKTDRQNLEVPSFHEELPALERALNSEVAEDVRHNAIFGALAVRGYSGTHTLGEITRGSKSPEEVGTTPVIQSSLQAGVLGQGALLAARTRNSSPGDGSWDWVRFILNDPTLDTPSGTLALAADLDMLGGNKVVFIDHHRPKKDTKKLRRKVRRLYA